MKMRLATTLGAAIAGVLLAASVASAQPQIIQRDCDTLSFDPPRVEVSFAVVNLGDIPVCSVHLEPVAVGQSEGCPIFSCTPPAGWFCDVTPTGGVVYRSLTPEGCIPPGEKLEFFKFIIDPPYCCYRAGFDGPDGQIFYEALACFQCESPVPTQRSTWGLVKGIYR